MTKLIDLNEWLPGHGENGVECKVQGATATVVVRYDGSNGEESKALTFSAVSHFSQGNFPGVSHPILEDVLSEDDFESGCVFVCENSSLAERWKEHWKEFSGIDRELSHFTIFFTGENKVIEVVAESVAIS